MIIDNIKQKLTEYRKDASRKHLVPFIQYVISEVEKIGKNKGNRATNDEESVSVIRKLINNQKQLFDVCDADKKIRLIFETNFLQSLLPSAISEVDMVNFIAKYDLKDRGLVIKEAKSFFGIGLDTKVFNEWINASLLKNGS